MFRARMVASAWMGPASAQLASLDPSARLVCIHKAPKMQFWNRLWQGHNRTNLFLHLFPPRIAIKYEWEMISGNIIVYTHSRPKLICSFIIIP
jgi:hypothetical protein